jgi:Na+-driven multidrug efflux pump
MDIFDALGIGVCTSWCTLTVFVFGLPIAFMILILAYIADRRNKQQQTHLKLIWILIITVIILGGLYLLAVDPTYKEPVDTALPHY